MYNCYHKKKLFNFIENIILVTILYQWDIHIINTSLLHSETTPVKQIYRACYKSDTKIEGYLRFCYQLHEHQTDCWYHVLYYEHTDMQINVKIYFCKPFILFLSHCLLIQKFFSKVGTIL